MRPSTAKTTKKFSKNEGVRLNKSKSGRGVFQNSNQNSMQSLNQGLAQTGIILNPKSSLEEWQSPSKGRNCKGTYNTESLTQPRIRKNASNYRLKKSDSDRYTHKTHISCSNDYAISEMRDPASSRVFAVKNDR